MKLALSQLEEFILKHAVIAASLFDVFLIFTDTAKDRF